MKTPEEKREYMALWRKANAERLRAYGAAYKASHTEQSRETSAKWRAKNADRIKARSTVWNAENKEMKRAWHVAWYAENSHTAKSAARDYALRHPERRRLVQHNREAKLRGRAERLSRGLYGRLFKLQRGKCACCRSAISKACSHMDHINPIALGGRNVDANIQLLCPTCNMQKHAKPAVVFMQSKGFLL